MNHAADPVLAHCLEQRPQMMQKLRDYIRCESVSTDPAYEPGMEKARCWLESYLHDNGFDSVQRLAAGGHPAIYAQCCHAPDKPTLLVYAHYDVQPPDPVDLWQTPPFEATIREGRIYARGVSDDKGPGLIALEVLTAYLQVEKAIPVNIKILVEGEEETGSPSLSKILDQQRDLLMADAVLSADGARWRADIPALNVGSRGNGGFGLTVRTAGKDMHSGRYGGAVPNALQVMSHLLATLHNTNGHVAANGFYDGVTVPGPAERRALAELPFNEQDWLAPLDAISHGEAGWSTLERLWYRPTVELNGLWGGYQGAGAKTVIPHEAHAKITTRLVTGQDPGHVERCLKQHLEQHCPDYARITFDDQHDWVGAYTLAADHPLLLAAEKALDYTCDKQPVRVRIGATLPLTDIIKKTLGLDTVMFSFSTADEDYHAPNEFLRVSAIDEGLTAWVRIMREVPGFYQ